MVLWFLHGSPLCCLSRDLYWSFQKIIAMWLRDGWRPTHGPQTGLWRFHRRVRFGSVRLSPVVRGCGSPAQFRGRVSTIHSVSCSTTMLPPVTLGALKTKLLPPITIHPPPHPTKKLKVKAQPWSFGVFFTSLYFVLLHWRVSVSSAQMKDCDAHTLRAHWWKSRRTGLQLTCYC